MKGKTTMNCQSCGAVPDIPHHQPISTLNGTTPTRKDLRLVKVRPFGADNKLLCQLCMEGERMIIRDKQRAFEKARRTQDAFWSALRELEVEIGCDVDQALDLRERTLEDLVAEAADGEDGDEQSDGMCAVGGCCQKPVPDGACCLIHFETNCDHGKLLTEACGSCADDDCSCDERSWRGSLHDSACLMAGRPR